MMDNFKLEILLPIYHNPDENGIRNKIDGDELKITYRELIKEFGGCSHNGSPIHGNWINPNTGQTITDELNNLWIVFEGIDSHRDFLKDYKEKLKQRFKQDDIFMTVTHITIL